MSYTFAHLALAAFFCVALILGVWLTSREPRRSPRQTRALEYVSYCAAIFFFGVSTYLNGSAGSMLAAIVTAAVCIFLAIWLLIRTGRIPSRKESLANFVFEPGLCGQCDYDLKGCESAHCPECGWELPIGPIQLERRDWVVWWHGWQIEYLDNWAKALTFVLSFTVMFGALFVFLLTKGSVISALPCLLSIHFLVNTVRIIQYRLRRDGAESTVIN